MGVVEIGTKNKINRQKQNDTNKNKNDQQIKSIKYMYIYAKTQPLEYGEASLILYDHFNFIYYLKTWIFFSEYNITRVQFYIVYQLSGCSVQTSTSEF